jgi:lipopolysaccharide/colanic/teichoic acid biosynthesis glycosyltransferase
MAPLKYSSCARLPTLPPVWPTRSVLTRESPPFGKLLRRTKLDELAQLWNVLWGEMSPVGPRPVLPELTYGFREYYTFLLRAQPGLTDPASLQYRQETRLLARAPNPMHFFKTVVTQDRIRLSFEYMGRATLWSDVATMAMTVAICCFPSLSRMYVELP